MSCIGWSLCVYCQERTVRLTYVSLQHKRVNKAVVHETVGVFIDDNIYILYVYLCVRATCLFCVYTKMVAVVHVTRVKQLLLPSNIYRGFSLLQYGG